jgi:hypothetical protein
MSDEAIADLREQMTNVRVDHAAMAVSVEHLTKAVNDLAIVVQSLRDGMNRSKGALAMLGLASSFVGGLIAWVTTLIFR